MLTDFPVTGFDAAVRSPVVTARAAHVLGNLISPAFAVVMAVPI